MKAITALVTCLVLFMVVEAAEREKANDRANKVMPERRVISLTAADQGTNDEDKRKNLHQILNVNSHYDFHLVRSAETVQGNVKRRLQLTYDGLPVLGVSLQATYDDNKGYTGGLSGDIVSMIENDIPDTSACQRENAFLLSLGKEKFGLPADCEHCNLDEDLRAVYLEGNNTAHLVYSFGITADTSTFSRPYLIVDACNLFIYEMFNRVTNPTGPNVTTSLKTKRNEQTVSNIYKRQACGVAARGIGGNPKTGRIRYGVNPYCLDVRRRGNVCRLINRDVRVTDVHHTRNAAGGPYRYNCFRANDAFNQADSPNLDAFFYGTVMTEVFRNEFNMHQPLGRQILIYTHFGNNYANAVWDGRAVRLGDGNNRFYPFVSLDLVAHETAHGMTDNYSNLRFTRQSGGINEAFSDITGEFVEFFASYRTNDWRTGFEIVKAANQAFRYFWNPPLDGRSIGHVRDYYDGLDVHYSSGIFNRAFFEMVYTQRIPMRDAYNCFLRANQMYWDVDTNFAEGACGVLSAAVDLGVNAARIRAAFAVVGIDTNNCGGGNAPLDNLNPGYIRISVSAAINPCFLLLPRNNYWYYVYIFVRGGTPVTITIINGVTHSVIGSRIDRLGYYLPLNGEDRIVCFSSNVPTTAQVDTYYCGRNQCYH